MADTADVVVIGGGQAGLAAGYYLRRTQLRFVILDSQDRPGGAWRHGWESLRLFSPAEYSPLPGWWMPRQPGEEFPTADHVVGYLGEYEQRYNLPVHRPVRVRGVHDAGAWMTVATGRGDWRARIVISATGTWDSPYLPDYPGGNEFAGAAAPHRLLPLARAVPAPTGGHRRWWQLGRPDPGRGLRRRRHALGRATTASHHA